MSEQFTDEECVKIGKGLLKSNDNKRALSFIEIAVLTYPNNLSLRIQHAEMAMKICDYGAALDRWQFIIENFTHFPQGVYWRKASCYILSKEFKRSREIIYYIIDRHGESQKAKDYLSLLDSEEANKYNIIKQGNNQPGVFVLEEKVEEYKNLKNRDLKSIRIRGWIKSTYENPAKLVVENHRGKKYLDLNVDRLDVKRALSEDVQVRCGFDYLIDLTSQTNIGYSLEGESIQVLSIHPKKVLDVLQGHDGWLFLANDSNRSIDQYTGKATLDKAKTDEWSDFCNDLATYKNDYKLIYIIANSKERVFPQYYPFEKGVNDLTQQVEDIFNAANINYLNPCIALSNNMHSYYKTDTHWSDLGAYIAYKETMHKLDLVDNRIEPTFKPIKVVGDLGSKREPNESSYVYFLNNGFTVSDKMVFDNCLVGTGSIKVFENTKHLISKTVLVFGGSSMHNYSKFLINTFKRVVCINLPGSIVKEVVDFEKPEIILLQTNERYLIKPGKCYESFNESPLFEYLINSPSSMKANILQKLGNNALEAFYKEKVLNAVGYETSS